MFILNPYRYATAAGTTYSYWNSADKSANATLSDSDKVVTSSSTATAWVRSLKAHSTGKRRVEFVFINQVDSTGVGFAHTGSTGAYIGSNTVGYCLYGNYGAEIRRYHNTAYAPFATTFADGDIVGLIIDLDAKLAWWDKNGVVISGNPTAGTGAMSGINAGDVYLAADPFGSTASIRLRTDPAEFTHVAPVGFTNGWPN
jgi:hypothetical protein